jgi:hypothetical protein
MGLVTFINARLAAPLKAAAAHPLEGLRTPQIEALEEELLAFGAEGFSC